MLITSKMKTAIKAIESTATNFVEINSSMMELLLVKLGILVGLID